MGFYKWAECILSIQFLNEIILISINGIVDDRYG